MHQFPLRIIPWSELQAIVPYTRQHILRLEKEGKFPGRVTVGANRVGWLLTEVEAWIKERVEERDLAKGRADAVHGGK